MNFDGFYGNERAKEYIKTAFARNAFPHALLIAGERGIGKKTLSSILAKALVCESDKRPCGECDSCVKASRNCHPDIRVLNADSSGIKVDDIRELKRDALLRPNDAERKVYIIDDAGSMRHDAQDALLKILEEPPHFTFFILLCSNYSDLLPTIISRTAHITLSPLSTDLTEKVIREKLPNITDAEVSELARTSGGICSFLTEDTESENLKFAEDIASALITKDDFEIFKAFSALEKSKRDSLASIMDELVVLLRDSIVFASDADSRPLSPISENVSKKISETFSTSRIAEFIEILLSAKSDCIRNIGVAHITGRLICDFAHTAANAVLKG